MKKVLCALFISLLTYNALAGDFEDGFHAAEKGDYKKALPLLKNAAKQGNAMAQVLLGFMYKNGKGLKQNSKEAVNSFRLAAEQGDAAAAIQSISIHHKETTVYDGIKIYSSGCFC